MEPVGAHNRKTKNLKVNDFAYIVFEEISFSYQDCIENWKKPLTVFESNTLCGTLVYLFKDIRNIEVQCSVPKENHMMCCSSVLDLNTIEVTAGELSRVLRPTLLFSAEGNFTKG